jgi:hypothetical protein
VRCRSLSWRPGHFEFRLVPITGSNLAAAQEQAPQNVDKYFGPRQTVTFKIMDHIPREPSEKLKSKPSESPAHDQRPPPGCHMWSSKNPS